MRKNVREIPNGISQLEATEIECIDGIYGPAHIGCSPSLNECSLPYCYGILGVDN